MKHDASAHPTGLVWAAILPHGPDTVLELTKDPALMAETRAAMQAAGQQFAAARVDTVILLDPLLVHTQNSFANRALFKGDGALSIGTAPHAAGTLGSVDEQFECDQVLARSILEASRAAAIPAAEDAGQLGVQKLVYGALIPLWFTVRPLPHPRPQIVAIAPSPAVPREALIRFGSLLAKTAANSGKRVAIIASADHGHTHDPLHQRFGFSPAAAQYDAAYCAAVKANRLERLQDLSEAMLIDSWSDSLWMTLVLAGALQTVPLHVNFLSYAVPSYYGMVVATYQPAQ